MFSEIRDAMLCLADAADLSEFEMDVAAAYLPGWDYEFSPEGEVAYIDTLTQAIFGR